MTNLAKIVNFIAGPPEACAAYSPFSATVPKIGIK